LYETWIDQAAFDAHIALPHVQRLLGLLGGLLESPPQASRWYRLEHMPDSKCRISQLGTA
jgi:quinol monooxygenase YgiN